jgi:hypothetical protein
MAELAARDHRVTEAVFGVTFGVDPMKLEEAGWGVIFAHDADPGIREALAPLLDRRRSQAAAKKEHFYKECVGPAAYRPGETRNKFLTRHGAGFDAADPEKMPYYLLIVGDPETIPYEFQYQLDVTYAVGRLHFEGETPERTRAMYAAYARSVVAAETAGVALPRRAAFFGVRNKADRATQRSADHLVTPLAERIAAAEPAWEVRTALGDAALKADLGRLLGGAETPALLFTASHGVRFDPGDPRQIAHQGALLCGDWPGPLRHQGPITDDLYFSADDVAADARLHGLIAFHFACYGAGTPRQDAFAPRIAGATARPAIAPRAFVAGLPQRLLAHEPGGALAVIGHVERAWDCSFIWGGAGEQLGAFEAALTQLLAGCPVGLAFECFNNKHAALSVALAAMLEDIKFGARPDNRELSSIWTANNDARGYAILGDPAVRLLPRA